MIEKPFEAIGKLAQKCQAVATKVAVKAATLANAMNRKVASIEARRVARTNVRAMARLPMKPTAEFVREVGTGRVSISLYRVRDHRAGTIRKVYGINRIQPDGRRVRLVTGPAEELRNLREVINQPLGLTPRIQQAAQRGPRPLGKAIERGPRSPERAASLKQQNAPTAESRQAAERPVQTRWFTLLYVEKAAPDGAAQGRVVRSFTTLGAAERHQKRHPFLRIEGHTGERPLPRGQVVPLKLSSVEVQRIEVSRQKSQQQALSNQVVNRPAIQHQRRQEQGR